MSLGKAWGGKEARERRRQKGEKGVRASGEKEGGELRLRSKKGGGISEKGMLKK